MEGFSYTDIFETKGIEYIIVIAFLIIVIPFWLILNRKKSPVLRSLDVSAGFIPGLIDIPMGIFFSRNHAWTYLERSGLAKTGIDEFILRAAGKVKMKYLKKEGEIIRKGEIMAEIIQDGKKLRVLSPLSGVIESVNYKPAQSSDYSGSWAYGVRPTAWIAETGSYFMADEAVSWIRKEFERFRTVMDEYFNRSGQAITILQDGGEIQNNPLSEMPDEAWHIFEKSFLTSEAEY